MSLPIWSGWSRWYLALVCLAVFSLLGDLLGVLQVLPLPSADEQFRVLSGESNLHDRPPARPSRRHDKPFRPAAALDETARPFAALDSAFVAASSAASFGQEGFWALDGTNVGVPRDPPSVTLEYVNASRTVYQYHDNYHEKGTGAGPSKGAGTFLKLAYCLFEDPKGPGQYRAESRRSSEWFAKELARGFTALYERVETVACAPTEEYVRRMRSAMPGQEAVDDSELLLLMGLGPDVDIRLCWHGSSSVVKTLVRLKQGKVSHVPVPTSQANRFADAARHVHVPASPSYVSDGSAAARRVGPLLVRRTGEPWKEEVDGVELQVDTKRELRVQSPSSVGLFMPYAILHFGKRVSQNLGSGEGDVFARRHGCCATSMRDAVRRTGFFDASARRLAKTQFASFAQSHCHTYRLGTAVRHAFVYTLAETLGKPVSLIGRCPESRQSEKRAGLAVGSRSKLRNKYMSVDAPSAHADHKFAIVFENSFVEGYVTEKIVDAYLGAAVPIYFGADSASLSELLNPRAYVRCHVEDDDAVSEEQLKVFFKKQCPGMKNGNSDQKTKDCLDRFDLAVKNDPYIGGALAKCTEQVARLDADDAMYDAMLREPLVPSGEMSGLWNFTYVAELVDTVMRIMVNRESIIDVFRRP